MNGESELQKKDASNVEDDPKSPVEDEDNDRVALSPKR